MKEITSGTIITGEDAPLASELNAWMDAHPGWVVVIYWNVYWLKIISGRLLNLDLAIYVKISLRVCGFDCRSSRGVCDKQLSNCPFQKGLLKMLLDSYRVVLANSCSNIYHQPISKTSKRMARFNPYTLDNYLCRKMYFIFPSFHSIYMICNFSSLDGGQRLATRRSLA